MGKQIQFDYYYGIEAEQFSFYRVPRLLIKDERFKGLSSDATLIILTIIRLTRMILIRVIPILSINLTVSRKERWMRWRMLMPIWKSSKRISSMSIT